MFSFIQRLFKSIKTKEGDSIIFIAPLIMSYLFVSYMLIQREHPGSSILSLTASECIFVVITGSAMSFIPILLCMGLNSYIKKRLLKGEYSLILLPLYFILGIFNKLDEVVIYCWRSCLIKNDNITGKSIE